MKSAVLLIIGLLCLTSFPALNTQNEVRAIPSQYFEVIFGGWGSGNVSYSYSGGSGIVSSNQSQFYLSVTSGMQINLTSYPDPGSAFAGWAGGSGCIVWNSTLLSTLVTTYSGNSSVIAYFVSTYTVSITSLYGGSVFYSYNALPSGVVNGTVFSGQTINLTAFTGGISLTATPNVGYIFCLWFTTGPVSVSNSSSSTTTLTVNGNGAIAAGVFAPQGSNIDPTSWPMFHNDLEHSGFSTSIAPMTNQTLWTFAPSFGFSLYASPAIVKGVVYVGSENYGDFYALNASNGAIIWTAPRPASNAPVTDCPAATSGVVYVGRADGYLYAYAAATGAYIWNYSLCPQGGGADIRSSPCVANGIVYIGSKDNNIFALNAATGALVWDYFTNQAVFSSPAVVNGLVYIEGMSYVYALNAQTGAVLWTYEVGGAGNIKPSPAVANNVVFVGCSGYGNYPSGIYAFNASTGKNLWIFQTPTTIFSSPAVAYGIVYEGCVDGNVYAVNETTGALIWSYQTGTDVESSPAVADGVVYVGSDDGNFYALNALTGISIWNYTTGGSVCSSPAIADGVVYVCSDYGDLYAFGQAPNPLFVNISCNSLTLDVGQSQMFNSTISGGASPYSYQWYLNGSAVSGATNSTWAFSPVSAGSYTVYLNVTDNVGSSVDSNSTDLTVNAQPQVAITPGAAAICLGQSQTYNSTVSGGTSPFSYQWYLNGSSVPSATNPTWIFTPTSYGSYSIYVNVTDSAEAQATSNTANVTVSIHDVAVTSFTSSKTVVGQGYGLNLTVTAADLGNYTETFDVTVYANTTSIATQNVTLSNGNSANVTFTWNTTGFTYGNYTMSAYAWPVAGETNTANNNCTDGQIIVSIPGDLTGGTPNPWDFVPDGVVDGSDLSIVARCFGSWPGARPPIIWNVNCDVNNDGVVDGGDLTIVARAFGTGSP